MRLKDALGASPRSSCAFLTAQASPWLGDGAGYFERMSPHSGRSDIPPAVRVLSWDWKDSAPFDVIEQYVNELLRRS
jgi:hypothetical protein